MDSTSYSPAESIIVEIHKMCQKKRKTIVIKKIVVMLLVEEIEITVRIFAINPIIKQQNSPRE